MPDAIPRASSGAIVAVLLTPEQGAPKKLWPQAEAPQHLRFRHDHDRPPIEMKRSKSDERRLDGMDHRPNRGAFRRAAPSLC